MEIICFCFRDIKKQSPTLSDQVNCIKLNFIWKKDKKLEIRVNKLLNYPPKVHAVIRNSI